MLHLANGSSLSLKMFQVMEPVTFVADLGALGNYPNSPFYSDSDILLDSPEQDDIGKQNLISCSLFHDCFREKLEKKLKSKVVVKPNSPST